jgi:hypothetical protein
MTFLCECGPNLCWHCWVQTDLSGLVADGRGDTALTRRPCLCAVLYCPVPCCAVLCCAVLCCRAVQQ